MKIKSLSCHFNDAIISQTWICNEKISIKIRCWTSRHIQPTSYSTQTITKISGSNDACISVFNLAILIASNILQSRTFSDASFEVLFFLLTFDSLRMNLHASICAKKRKYIIDRHSNVSILLLTSAIAIYPMNWPFSPDNSTKPLNFHSTVPAFWFDSEMSFHFEIKIQMDLFHRCLRMHSRSTAIEHGKRFSLFHWKILKYFGITKKERKTTVAEETFDISMFMQWKTTLTNAIKFVINFYARDSIDGMSNWIWLLLMWITSEQRQPWNR